MNIGDVGAVDNFKEYLSFDRAMTPQFLKPSFDQTPGGIDLNGKGLGLDVIKQGQGVSMTLDPEQIAQFRKGDFTGLIANIIRITPITNPAVLLDL